MQKTLVELPGFDAAAGRPSDAAVEAYERDGVVCLRGAFDAHWVEALRDGVDRAMADALQSGRERNARGVDQTETQRDQIDRDQNESDRDRANRGDQAETEREQTQRGDQNDRDRANRGDKNETHRDQVESDIDQHQNQPQPRNQAVRVAKPGEAGCFFYDMFLWRRYAVFRAFAFESPAADLARRIMRSDTLTFYYDLVLSKEPGAGSPTPWHYDEAYWPVAGTQVCNLWTALDDIPEATALRFARGSHRRAENHRAVGFGPGIEYQGQNDPPPPDWDADADADAEIVYAPLSPGDCLIINLRTHHSAPGNLSATRRRAHATHWLGDDARYNDKPWQCDPDERGQNLAHGGKMECAIFPRVR